MRKKIPTLSKEQTSALINSTWGFTQERDRQILKLLLNTGLKINEFVNLNVGHVYSGKLVRMNLILPGKNGKSSRKIPLNREAREAVAFILDYNRSQGFAPLPDDPIVVSRQKNKTDGSYRITPRQVQRIIKTLRMDAAVGFKTTPQTLRHTYAKTVLGEGGDLKTLQKLLGHRSIKTTRDLYGVAIEAN